MAVFQLGVRMSLPVIFLFIYQISYAKPKISDVESLVKRAVVKAYTNIITEKDIWGLEFSENKADGCNEVVFGYTKVPTGSKDPSVYWFLVCLEQYPYSQNYEARLIYNDIVIEEKKWWWPF